MPAAEIKALRQAGKLDEALIMAQEELTANPENIWGKRNISWVYYAYLKKHTQDFNYEGFIDNLHKIMLLNLPEEEVMVFDALAYQIGSMIFKIQKSEPVDFLKLNNIFSIITYFHFTKPGESYSFLMKAFIKVYQYWLRFTFFTEWWGLENFTEADYKTEEYKGKQLPSLVEKVYSALCKLLIEGEAVDRFGIVREVDKEKNKTVFTAVGQSN